jgi:DNA repair protein RadC
VNAGEILVPLTPTFLSRLAFHFGALDEEVLLLVYLDRSGAFLSDDLIRGGTRGSHGMTYRRLFERAFNRGAAGLLLAHNHPSGSARPSKLDVASTRKLQALAAPMEIELVDHLIVGAREVFSMRAAGLVIS